MKGSHEYFSGALFYHGLGKEPPTAQGHALKTEVPSDRSVEPLPSADTLGLKPLMDKRKGCGIYHNSTPCWTNLLTMAPHGEALQLTMETETMGLVGCHSSYTLKNKSFPNLCPSPWCSPRPSRAGDLPHSSAPSLHCCPAWQLCTCGWVSAGSHKERQWLHPTKGT